VGRSANYGPAAPDQAATAAPALHAALALVRHVAATHRVDTSRIYAVGFSMGGSAAWLSPTLAPGQFAAIVPIAGIAPPNTAASAYTHLPVLAMHGDTDDENPITADRRFVRVLRVRGGQAVLREYHGLAHQPPADIVPGTWWRDWLFQQKQMLPRQLQAQCHGEVTAGTNTPPVLHYPLDPCALPATPPVFPCLLCCLPLPYRPWLPNLHRPTTHARWTRCR
jgi:pimeloyl-ACP methyl ester carboxylesterase